MRIIYLITGSGGSFYCGNCYRDMLYVKAIRLVKGVSASAVPLYLPPDRQLPDNEFDRNVFFGAISMYLREKVSFLHDMPDFIEKIVDSGPALKLAAGMAGTTRTEGLEDLTLNMIKGDKAFRGKETDRLVNHMLKDGEPDIVHLSNALIIGIARQLKKRINGIRVVCSLLNEDDWIDEMAEPYRTKAWQLITEEAGSVDAFITPSVYYKSMFEKTTGINGKNIHVVPLGFEPGPYREKGLNSYSPSIGYFSRVTPMNGFDKLADAFIKLKSEKRLPGLTLHVCGGYTGDDKPYLRQQIRKIRKAGFGGSVKIYPDFHGVVKQEFFNNIDIVSVPVRKHDGYGLYVLEANAAGVPAVQPDTGAFREIIEKTQGGIIYEPDTVDKLAEEIARVLEDGKLREMLGKNGSSMVRNEFSLAKMSLDLSDVYFQLR